MLSLKAFAVRLQCFTASQTLESQSIARNNCLQEFDIYFMKLQIIRNEGNNRPIVLVANCLEADYEVRTSRRHSISNCNSLNWMRSLFRTDLF